MTERGTGAMGNEPIHRYNILADQYREQLIKDQKFEEEWEERIVRSKPKTINIMLRHCINAVVVILLVSILFKVNIDINVENLGKLILMGIVCSWFDKEVFK